MDLAYLIQQKAPRRILRSDQRCSGLTSSNTSLSTLLQKVWKDLRSIPHSWRRMSRSKMRKNQSTQSTRFILKTLRTKPSSMPIHGNTHRVGAVSAHGELPRRRRTKAGRGQRIMLDLREALSMLGAFTKTNCTQPSFLSHLYSSLRMQTLI